MELQTVVQVSRTLGISAQMLRYYERNGLIKSSRREDYAYRVYDGDAIKRLQQIVILRKLQIPVRQIRDILNNQDAVTVIEVFKQNINELDEQITALSTVRSILARFVEEMQQKADIQLKLDLLNDATMLAVVNSLSFSENKIKEKVSMEELNKTSETLSKLEDKDVRIIYLPPATVAAVHFVGDDAEGRIPEDQGGDIITAFVSKLEKVKPDCRHYGFNHDADGKHGYERWYTIPDDMEVPTPFVKKQFSGGVYGAYTLRTSFDEWDLLLEWANQHEKFDFAQGSPETMLGLLEEHLNEMGRYVLPNVKFKTQIDLLIPLKEKQEWTDGLGYIADSENKCGYKATLVDMKAFTVAGYMYTPSDDAGDQEFYKELTNDGRLELMKTALKHESPILVYHHYSAGYRTMVCIDIKNAVNKKYFESDEMKTKSIRKKKWIQFDMTMEDMRNNQNFAKWNPHNLIHKLGYKFDGSAGFFVAYQCKELVVTEENKNESLYCWMPVVPL